MNNTKFAASEWLDCDLVPSENLISNPAKNLYHPILIKLINDPNVYLGYFVKFGGDLELMINQCNTNQYRLLEKWAIINL